MKIFSNITQLIVFLLPIFWFVYGLDDLAKLMGDGVYLFIYFIAYTCYTIRDINERCYRIETKLVHIMNDIEIVDNKINKLQKYIED